MKGKKYLKILLIPVILLCGIVLLKILLQNNVLIKKEIMQEVARVDKKLATSVSASWSAGVSQYTDSDGNVVPVPKGYVVSGISTENKVKTGLVIYEGTASVTSTGTAQTSRNQWVWVPVKNPSRIYAEDSNGIKTGKLYNYSSTGRTQITDGSFYEPATILNNYDTERIFSVYGLQGVTKESFYQKEQIEFDQMIESIKKYGGFYIGRYETANISQKVPIIQKQKNDCGRNHWYQEWDHSENLAPNTSVKTSIIWGCLWDETLQWFIDSGSKTYATIANASSWANFLNSKFTYTSSSGSSATKNNGSGTYIYTGSTSYTVCNNIYDLVGNYNSWSHEKTKNGAVYRSGDWDSSTTEQLNAGFRREYNPQGGATSIGYRAIMYIR